MTQTTRRTTRPYSTKGHRSMGASRDFTTGEDIGAATALLERDNRRGTQRTARTRTPERREVRPRRSTHGTTSPHGPRYQRLGSQQVVSQRGRRLTPIKKNSLFARLSAVAIVLLIGGVCLAMWLSGLSTSQTFKIQQLSAQESQLSNQIETLNRDLENVRSTADVARRAADANMGVPTNPGVVEVAEDGKVEEKRAATDEQEAIIDVNGTAIRPGRASSNPDDTEGMSDSLNATPDGHRSPQADSQRQGEDRQQNAESNAPRADELPDLPVRAPYSGAGN
ncbi:hypothetical protein ACEE62_03835 [Corynebacterium sp. 32222D000BW]